MSSRLLWIGGQTRDDIYVTNFVTVSVKTSVHSNDRVWRARLQAPARMIFLSHCFRAGSTGVCHASLVIATRISWRELDVFCAADSLMTMWDARDWCVGIWWRVLSRVGSSASAIYRRRCYCEDRIRDKHELMIPERLISYAVIWAPVHQASIDARRQLIQTLRWLMKSICFSRLRRAIVRPNFRSIHLSSKIVATLSLQCDDAEFSSMRTS